MKEEKKVSVPVIRRLPRYLRHLKEAAANGIRRISSKEIGRKLGATDSQVRQDLNNFGGFGQQGYGYDTETLSENIGHILCTDRNFTAILVGAGSLGTALAKHMGFERYGVTLLALFDNNPEVIGSKISRFTVRPVSEITDFCRKNNPDIAVLTLPGDAVDRSVEILESMRIKGFWNFTGRELNIPGVAIENVHLEDSLMMLTYAVGNPLAHKKETK